MEKNYKEKKRALAAVAQWIECWPANLRVAGWIPRAHDWVAGQVPSRGHTRGNHTLMFLSSFSHPSLFSLYQSINKIMKEVREICFL